MKETLVIPGSVASAQLAGLVRDVNHFLLLFPGLAAPLTVP